jgi:hypothetical protein
MQSAVQVEYAGACQEEYPGLSQQIPGLLPALLLGP